MHDWTMIAIHFDWTTGRVVVELRNRSSMNVAIVAEGVSRLHVPRLQDWGPSVSINQVRGPTDIGGGKRLSVEMQSGDIIEISASSFVLPVEA